MTFKNPAPDDAELVRMISLKSRAGAELLYDKYAIALLLCIIRIVPEKKIAEDILEDTFLKIWSNIDCYSFEKGRFFTWMIAIARNLAKNNQNAISPQEMYESIIFKPKFNNGSTTTQSADYENECPELQPIKALFRSAPNNLR